MPKHTLSFVLPPGLWWCGSRGPAWAWPELTAGLCGPSHQCSGWGQMTCASAQALQCAQPHWGWSAPMANVGRIAHTYGTVSTYMTCLQSKNSILRSGGRGGTVHYILYYTHIRVKTTKTRTLAYLDVIQPPSAFKIRPKVDIVHCRIDHVLHLSQTTSGTQECWYNHCNITTHGSAHLSLITWMFPISRKENSVFK